MYSLIYYLSNNFLSLLNLLKLVDAKKLIINSIYCVKDKTSINNQHTMFRRIMHSKVTQRGFSLIEIMVVIVIMGVLASLIVPKIMGRPDEARIIAAKQDIASISQALKLYKLDNQRYPTTDQGLQSLVTKPSTPPIPSNWKSSGYLEKIPVDPWGNPYQYLYPGTHSEIDVFSLGVDGAIGGEGNDVDIGSWDQ
jgi:general secretion pathway protein G